MPDKSILQSAFSSDSPSTPSGYILNEVSNYSFINDSNCIYLESYLIKKLKKNDPITKFKCLRIIKHLCDKGNPSFKMLIQRHANQIKHCQGYKGVYDPVYGDTLSELVREEASHCLKSIFSSNNRSDCNIRVTSGDNMRVIGTNNRMMGSKMNNCGDSGSNSCGVSNYGNRIHGFGNPNFIDNCEYSDKSNISSIGNSIIYNAKIGRYSQVVEDISDLVLKVIPNKLINGISNYYTGTGNGTCGLSSANCNRQRAIYNLNSNIRPERNILEYSGDTVRRNGAVNGFSSGSIVNDFYANGERINSKQEHLCRFSRFESKKENSGEKQISYVKNDLLEANFIENYCSVTGLIVTPSNEQLQNSIREILKLDVPLVISLLHEKLKHYYYDHCEISSNNPNEKNSEHNKINIGSDSVNIDDSKCSLSPNNANSNKVKVVHRILCLLLSLLELNETTKDYLINYSDHNFTQLLNNISNHNSQFKKKAKLITEIINSGYQNSTGNRSGVLKTDFASKDCIEITDNLIDIDDQQDNNVLILGGNGGFKGSEVNIVDPSGNSDLQKTENTKELNTLFKNLSIKNRKVSSEHFDNKGPLSDTITDSGKKESGYIGSLIDFDF
ncbi:hypothetical protein FG386_001196 [Cryptosporidium ryanae]|uniref:uncharacterized protein n=1 Tax=Cryptosporidium ryanae TaxID=515981 RepID=UPI00351A3041|nr:hypothetical protein FG386_001196 [Cryptosporidium ryanae]